LNSTKNKAGARDPEMSSTRKGNDWFFGMKAHVGVDAQSGIVHSLETTTAKVHDSQVWDELLHGAETSVWADRGYVSAAREAAFAGPGKFWGVMRKAPKGGRLDPIEADINRLIARVRARVEHPFRVIKRPFGHVKARYRGLAKNRAQLFTLFAPGNLFLMRRATCGMRRSLPRIAISAAQAAQTAQKSPETAPSPIQSAFKQKPRRSRSP
jgi:IS5 family transposase